MSTALVTTPFARIWRFEHGLGCVAINENLFALLPGEG
jgi:hypothetical protein